MAVIRRQWRTWLAVVALLAGVFLFWGDRHTGYAAGDVTVSSPTDFATLDASDGTVDGVFNLMGNLLIDTGGSINCNDPAVPNGASACAINIVGGGDLTMNAGSGIFAENRTDGGAGANIQITVSGDFTMHGPSGGSDGAIISSRKLCFTGPCGTADGGNITIIVGGVTVNNGIGQCNTRTGDVLIEKGATITSDSIIGDAGDIRIYAGRNISVDGVVRAQGNSTTGQGGLIWLDACCSLLIDDDGHVVSAGLDPGADLVHLEGCVVTINGLVESLGVGHEVNAPSQCGNRPGKPADSTSCVEIWSGTTITIDGTAPENGQVRAEAQQVPGRSWIDILANLDISLIGDPTLPYPNDNNETVPNWVVNSNETDQNGIGGQVTVISKSGLVSTSGRAIQANASTTSNGGAGGSIQILAGGAGAAGDVALDGASIEAMGDNSGGGSQAGGTIDAKSFNGDITGAAPGWLNASGGGGDGDAGDEGSVRLTSCVTPTTYTGASTPGAVVNSGPPFCGGIPAFPAPADTLLPSGDCAQFCQPGITPTPVELTPTPTPTPGVFCEKLPVQTVLAGRIPDIIVRTDLGQSIQSAVNNVVDNPASPDGYLIVGVVNNGNGTLGGHVSQRVTISQVYSKPFLLIGCSVTMHDPNRGDGLPTGLITAGAGSPGNIFIMDLHGADSEVAGWKVEGNGRTVRNTGGSGSPVGIWFVGNSNTMHNGSGSFNTGVGLKIDGSFNYATDTDVYGNSSHGVQVTGSSNQLLKIDSGDKGKGNGGDGFNVSGNSNILSEDDAFANTGNGFTIVGNLNQVLKGRSGDSGKGNGGDGYNILGAGNILTESRASSNKGDGWDVSGGVSGSANKFKSDLSNTGSSGSSTLENTGFEYRWSGWVQNNGGGSKADSLTLPVAGKNGCASFPTSPNSLNLSATCE